MTFEAARGVVHAWQSDHMVHRGITPGVLRGKSLRMAGVQPHAFPPEVASRAQALLKGTA
jgi:hypothetical protein